MILVTKSKGLEQWTLRYWQTFCMRQPDIQAVYAEWSGRGAEFLTPPKQHETEIRCYLRDPDGHLIEVGQTTTAKGWRPPSPHAVGQPPASIHERR